MMYAMNFFGVIFLWALGTGIATTVLYYTVKQAVKNGMDESIAGQNTPRRHQASPTPTKTRTTSNATQCSARNKE
jgi:hypothetical protein